MRFDDFIKEGKVRTATPDNQMAKSIIKNTFEDLQFLKETKLTEISKRKLVSNYYDSLRSLLEAISLLKGSPNKTTTLLFTAIAASGALNRMLNNPQSLAHKEFLRSVS